MVASQPASVGSRDDRPDRVSLGVIDWDAVA
jgi:hypothetical protein